MGSFYFYKLVADNGGAPCIDDKLLSLAICKPMIRSTAKCEDIIFGFAANSLHADNRLLYIARITTKEYNGEYYKKTEFSQRGDCIYECRGGLYAWRENSLHHGPDDLPHDIGEFPDYRKANVLLSDDFRYFGKNGNDDYKKLYPEIKYAIESLGRGHRVNHNQELRDQLQELKNYIWEEYPQKVNGKPTSEARRGICHRTKSCGVV